MRNELTKEYGDPSNSFSFANFFPERIREPFEKISNYTYKGVSSIPFLKKLLRPTDQYEKLPLSTPEATASSLDRHKAMTKMDKELDSLLQ